MTRYTKAEMIEIAQSYSTILPKTARLERGRNTISFETENGERILQYHWTPVVIKNFNGDILLDTGGWRTSTTKERINRELPPGLILWQENHVWYLGGYRRDKDAPQAVEFVDGTMIVNGEVILPDDAKEKLEERSEIRKMIMDYCKGLQKHLEKVPGNTLPLSNDDCFICRFRYMHSTDHFLSHFEEEYYMGSMIWSAMVYAGYRSPEVLFHRLEPVRAAQLVKRYLYRQFNIA